MEPGQPGKDLPDYQIKCWQSQAQINARKTKTGNENTSVPCKNESNLWELADQRKIIDQGLPGELCFTKVLDLNLRFLRFLG